MQLSSATFATKKVWKLLLQIARSLSKVKVSKLFSQLFAPIKSVHEESCEESLQTLTFFATFCSHKKRCYAANDLTAAWFLKVAFVMSPWSRSIKQRNLDGQGGGRATHVLFSLRVFVLPNTSHHHPARLATHVRVVGSGVRNGSKSNTSKLCCLREKPLKKIHGTG